MNVGEHETGFFAKTSRENVMQSRLVRDGVIKQLCNVRRKLVCSVLAVQFALCISSNNVLAESGDVGCGSAANEFYDGKF